MYFFEPFLNAFYKIKMKSILDFDEATTFTVPDVTPEIKNHCLLYIHVPFCESLCPYCSFHRFVFDESIAEPYFRALWREMEMYKEKGYNFQSIYVGGGTPTISIPHLKKTLDLARELFSIREISVETNPNHLEADILADLKQMGVNRLSVGVQSFDDDVLRTIGRLERYGSGEMIKEKIRQTTGIFDTLNVDLIFNMPTQSEESILKDLDIIDELLPEQVTFYPLMTAPSVKAVLKRSLGAISYIREKRYYNIILNRMKRNYTGSTAWCFSRKSSMIDEYIIAFDNYAAAGSGAFGYINDCIYANTFSINEYIDRIKNGLFPVTRIRRFDEKERIYYYFLMKLFGLTLDKEAFAAHFSKSYHRALPAISILLRLTGSAKEDKKNVTLTDVGRYYWIMAMREFFIAVDTMRDLCRDGLDDQGHGPL